MPRPAIKLVPWDPDSPAHVERLVEQRKACGWAADRVIGWRDTCFAGTKCIWWITLASPDPELIEKHISRYPTEKEALTDTSKALRGVSRDPTLTEILPIGHVALELEHLATADLGLTLPTQDAFWIKSLYVSYALQNLGIGGVTMDTIEGVATSEPLNGKHLLLDTLFREDATNEAIASAYYGGVPKLAQQDWYARRGYEVVGDPVPGFYQEADKNGKIWLLRTVFMHRDLLKAEARN